MIKAPVTLDPDALSDAVAIANGTSTASPDQQARDLHHVLNYISGQAVAKATCPAALQAVHADLVKKGKAKAAAAPTDIWSSLYAAFLALLPGIEQAALNFIIGLLNPPPPAP